MRIQDLTPNPKNPRKISEKRLGMLQKSLEKFGDLGCFVYNTRTKRLISGHQRQKSIPADACIVLEKYYEPPTNTHTVAEGFVDIRGEHFKYREVDADEIWESEAMIAANKHGGEWDNAKLKELVIDIPTVDMEAIGLSVPEIQRMGIDSPTDETTEQQSQESESMKSIFEVVVVCKSELDQREKYEKLSEMGYECRVLSM